MTTTTLTEILTPELADYARDLIGAGFRVYVFTSNVQRVAKGGRPGIGTWLAFSRDVDGRECWGSVSRSGTWGGHTFSMPIKPSRQNGSGMFIGGDEINDFDELTVANAELYASPTGHNRLVGRQDNYGAEGYRGLVTEATDTVHTFTDGDTVTLLGGFEDGLPATIEAFAGFNSYEVKLDNGATLKVGAHRIAARP